RFCNHETESDANCATSSVTVSLSARARITRATLANCSRKSTAISWSGIRGFCAVSYHPLAIDSSTIFCAIIWRVFLWIMRPGLICAAGILSFIRVSPDIVTVLEVIGHSRFAVYVFQYPRSLLSIPIRFDADIHCFRPGKRHCRCLQQLFNKRVTATLVIGHCPRDLADLFHQNRKVIDILTGGVERCLCPSVFGDSVHHSGVQRRNSRG